MVFECFDDIYIYIITLSLLREVAWRKVSFIIIVGKLLTVSEVYTRLP